MYISLDYEDFKCLVRGGVLKVYQHHQTVCICLKDIGFDKMDEAIGLADQGIDTYKDHEKELK